MQTFHTDFTVSVIDVTAHSKNAHLVTIGNFILAIEVVPNVNHTVHPRHKEYPCPRGAETTTRQIRAVILP